jgi:hypothetical protein
MREARRNLEAFLALPKEASAMARFYFHIQEGADLIKDEEGTDLPSADHAREEALQAAREICSEAIKTGEELKADALALVIVDEHGKQLGSVPIIEVLPMRLRSPSVRVNRHAANDDALSQGAAPMRPQNNDNTE